MFKTLALIGTGLIGLGLSALLPPSGPDGPPPPDAKKKGPDAKKKKGPDAKKKEHGPAGDLRRAYDALQRLRLGAGREGRAEERLRDWSRRAGDLYRKGVQAFNDGDERLAHEYGASAHDLARAADHAGNAARLDRRDDDLPPPPGGSPGEGRARVVRDLRRAYDRIRAVEDQDPPAEAGFYLDAARDLYSAARRDVEGDRIDRAGELARAAEAMTHVPEHLAHAAGRGPDGPPPPDRKEARKGRRLGPADELPPPIR